MHKFTFQSQASRYHKGVALPAEIYVFPTKTLGGSTRQCFLQLLRNHHVQYDSITQPDSNQYIQARGLRAENSFYMRRVLYPILDTIYHDGNIIFQRMHLELNDITVAMSQDEIIRDRISAWRRLLGTWRLYLFEYKKSLNEVIDFLRVGIEAGEQPAKDLTEQYKALLSDLNSIEIKVGQSFDAIMFTMSIIESKQAIAQADSISKLTELAVSFSNFRLPLYI
jgi:hypothetical protein